MRSVKQERTVQCPAGTCLFLNQEKSLRAMGLSPSQLELAEYFDHEKIHYLLEQFQFIQELAVCWSSDVDFEKGERTGLVPIFELIKIMQKIWQEKIIEDQVMHKQAL